MTSSGPVTSGAQLGAAAQHSPLQVGQGVLVLVTLYGGNDGLNTVIPYADPVYQSSRPDLAYSEKEVLDLGEGLGFNPAMTGLHQMWQRKLCAVVRGVGYPKPNHSHFVSMDIWQTASPAEPSGSGWLGRWLDSQPDDGVRALKAVSVGGTLPPLLGGEATAGSSLPIGDFHLPGAGALRQGFQGLGGTYSGDSAVAAYAARDIGDLFTVAQTFTPVLSGGAANGGASGRPTSATSGTGRGAIRADSRGAPRSPRARPARCATTASAESASSWPRRR